MRGKGEAFLKGGHRRELPSAYGKVYNFAGVAQVTLPTSKRQLVNDTVHKAMVNVEIRSPVILGRIVIVQVSRKTICRANPCRSGLVIETLRPGIYGQEGNVFPMMIHSDIPRMVFGISLPEAIQSDRPGEISVRLARVRRTIAEGNVRRDVAKRRISHRERLIDVGAIQ